MLPADAHCFRHCLRNLKGWPLLTGRWGGGGGGYNMGGGGACEVLPLQKGGTETVLAMLKGGHNKFWGSFYAVA